MIVRLISSIFLPGVFFLVFGIIGNAIKSKPNRWWGYRTPESRKSPENWDIANKFANKLLIKMGFIFLLIGIITAFLVKNVFILLATNMAGSIFAGFYIYFKVENYIKSQSGNKLQSDTNLHGK